MKEKLDSIVSKTLEKMQNVKTTEALNEIRVSVLGKKGELKEVMKGMKDVAPEDRPKVGQMVNEARDRIESKLAEMRQRLDQEKMERQMEGEKIDVTLPARKADIGHRHPNTIALEEMERIFI
ncbi:MAG TPA: phenylalanine--tRNA ligase subunit alpha, partial [Lachnospiraceae bacterium]|nr:phenylalanine--tRNA ligase subunit alpha [Lachnospiraceae bacterium]